MLPSPPPPHHTPTPAPPRPARPIGPVQQALRQGRHAAEPQGRGRLPGRVHPARGRPRQHVQLARAAGVGRRGGAARRWTACSMLGGRRRRRGERAPARRSHGPSAARPSPAAPAGGAGVRAAAGGAARGLRPRGCGRGGAGRHADLPGRQAPRHCGRGGGRRRLPVGRAQAHHRRRPAALHRCALGGGTPRGLHCPCACRVRCLALQLVPWPLPRRPPAHPAAPGQAPPSGAR